jgi:hypothetical protein
MAVRSSEIELHPLVPTIDEKYAAKNPFPWKKWSIVVVSLIGVAWYFTHGRPTETTDHSTSQEIHQAVHKTDAKAPSFTAGTDALTINGAGDPTRNGANATKSQPFKKGTSVSKTPERPLNVPEMMQAVAAARDGLVAQLRLQYGEYFDAMFLNGDGTSRGRTVFASGNDRSTLSWTRFRRKLIMKLLQTTMTDQNVMVPLVWATGGHSATAGHGNFYNESYTAYLGQAAKSVFRAVGIQFVARGYAMGGTAAAPEIALCAKEIFGADIDVLVWDFGMTDGNNIWKQLLYHWRAGLIKTSRPLHLAYHVEGSFMLNRQKAVQDMEDLGLAAMVSSQSVVDAVLAAVPDSFGLTEEQIAQMPSFVRNFKCETQIENGDPYCKTDKFDLSLCPNRKYRTNWHPGWKWHAVMGYLCAFFLFEVLDDALKELAAMTVDDPSSLREQLLSTETAEYARFATAPVPTLFQEVLPPSGIDGFSLETFIKSPNYCHTAKLPAEIRHKGILTESDQTGFFTYDKGISLLVAETTSNFGELMRLVYSDADRFECSRVMTMDYKDYFYVNRSDGWKKLVVPNDSALQEYGSGHPLEGMVVLCFALCPWEKCPKGALHQSTFPDQFQLKINGKAVSELWPLLECAIARHAEGYKWTPNANGRMEVSAQVLQVAPSGSYLRLSSVIVW